MNKLTYTICSLLLVGVAFSAEQAKKPSFAEEAFTKAIEANCKEASKNYEIYVKSLEVANQKIIKALEVTKSDLSDTKKFTKLTISDRADAIKEVDAKIAEIKKGSLGEAVVAAKGAEKTDLLGEKQMSNKEIFTFLKGEWDVTLGANGKEKWIFSGASDVTCGGLRGTLTIADKVVSLTWTNGWVHTFSATDISSEIQMTCPNGRKDMMKKIVKVK